MPANKTHFLKSLEFSFQITCVDRLFFNDLDSSCNLLLNPLIHSALYKKGIDGFLLNNCEQIECPTYDPTVFA